MNYQKHYVKLIERAVDRKLNCYHERHHILPKCMGGENKPGNIIKLTAEEHYIAHLLLCKIHPNNHKLLYAAIHMTMGNKKQRERINNKRYAWLRKRHAIMIKEFHTNRKIPYESKMRMSLAKRGRKRQPHSNATKMKMSEASLGRSKSPSHCAALGLINLGKRGEETNHHKLNDKKVKEIKIELRDKERPIRDIAIAHGVHRSVIESINKNKTWQHVKIINLTTGE